MTDNAKQAIDDLTKIYNWCIEYPMDYKFPMDRNDLATICLVAADLITSYSIAAEKAQKEAEQAKASRDYWQGRALAAEDRLQAMQEAEDEFMLCYGY